MATVIVHYLNRARAHAPRGQASLAAPRLGKGAGRHELAPQSGEAPVPTQSFATGELAPGRGAGF
jgi:hypothetical protein